MPKVVILGAGMGGLAATHELLDRGYQVELYEKLDVAGGKARSVRIAGTGGGDAARDLPAEHGFRFFPGFYRHVYDTMTRIQGKDGTVADSLIRAPDITLAMPGQPPFIMPSTIPEPTDFAGWMRALKALLVDNPELELPNDEKLFFLRKVVCFLLSGRNRRKLAYDLIPWSDYVDAASKSQAYRDILANGLTRSLVAMQPDRGSTLTVCTILVQILINILNFKQQSDRVLKGPTSDYWFNPWLNHFNTTFGANFEFHSGREVTGFVFDATDGPIGRITGVQVTDSTGNQQVVGSSADRFIAALPVEVMQRLLDPDPQGIKAASGLQDIGDLQTGWMNGVLYYTNRPVGEVRGHVIYVNSSWAITSIEQQQFWDHDISATYGDATGGGGTGPVRDIVSAIISEWGVPGEHSTTNSANATGSANEVILEAWEQIKHHRTGWGAVGRLSDGDKETEWLDEAIQHSLSETGMVTVTNAEPLLVNVVGTHAKRPPAATGIQNFFIASDYVHTHTDLATMEAANEAGRRAAIGILERDNPGGFANAPVIWPLDEPDVFEFLQQLDEVDFRPYENDPRNAPPPRLCRLLEQLPLDEFAGIIDSGNMLDLLLASEDDTMLKWVLLLLAISNLVLLGIVIFMLFFAT